jgi:hypothetical protein
VKSKTSVSSTDRLHRHCRGCIPQNAETQHLIGLTLAILHIKNGILRITIQVGAGLCIGDNDPVISFPFKIKPIKIKALKHIEFAFRPKTAVLKHDVLLQKDEELRNWRKLYNEDRHNLEDYSLQYIIR